MRFETAVLAERPNEATIRAAAKDLTKSIEYAAVIASRIVTEARPLLTKKQRSSIHTYMASNDKAVSDWLDEISK